MSDVSRHHRKDIVSAKKRSDFDGHRLTDPSRRWRGIARRARLRENGWVGADPIRRRSSSAVVEESDYDIGFHVGREIEIGFVVHHHRIDRSFGLAADGHHRHRLETVEEKVTEVDDSRLGLVGLCPVGRNDSLVHDRVDLRLDFLLHRRRVHVGTFGRSRERRVLGCGIVVLDLGGW